TVALTSCGDGSNEATSGPRVIHAGQVDIQLPPGWKVTKDGAVVRPASSSDVAAGSTATTTGDTIPLAKEDPQTKFFAAISSFQGCLKELGVKFVGAPDQSNPSSPANDPGYVKNLGTCAARSNIVQAMKDAQTAQDNLTPAQIKEQNKGFLRWRDCMIGLGWDIPEPKPDAKGRLFSFGGGGGSAPQITPPPGKDLLTSTDVRECAAQTQDAAGR
ncbi:MAG TPA: hypothetical protein VFO77_05010, partial [Actinoplanes sp.]|nr:hypothetical protein [Actinoplanes sp.]